ncbi:hypothetical protein KORDIASMS9_01288 [Kordia sp. SMS9]|uniref:hypothetical protein n=1 Tax=Kordia sp. SMS9 TaxID=2282170 RepID=UPI000E0CC01A|nr:hypothetical protein [Kordia sp. SMS9]AXG69069.1 hypothetical protein KORDIASMS9_01288 [Kordia sp. SMS9]
MKKILFLALILSSVLFNSCSVDDVASDIQFQFEFIPIESVEMPSIFNLGSTHTISVTYKRPSTCHTFSNFDYQQQPQNLRIVAVVNFVTPGNNCEPLEEEFKTETFNFSALDLEPYTFRFWQGKDDEGQDIFLTYEVPVEQ